jgi:DNA repair exonuclease SbcCD ATPase subunit
MIKAHNTKGERASQERAEMDQLRSLLMEVRDRQAALHTTHAEELADLRTTHVEELADLVKRLADLRTTHAEKLADLVKRQDSAWGELEQEHAKINTQMEELGGLVPE